MTSPSRRGCSICQRTPSAKCLCGQRLCLLHESVLRHDCAHSKKLLAMTSADVRRWKKEHAPEQALATAVVNALNMLPGVHVVAVDSGGARQRNTQRAEPGTADVLGWSSPDARFIAVETKCSHKAGCGCDSCSAQRAWGARLEAAGGVYVGNVRTVAEAVDGVRRGLASVRAGGR